MANEVMWLKRLAEFRWVPRIVAVEELSILMTYCGEKACLANLPDDWREQAERIVAELASVPCSHNDIKAEELLVLDGRLLLIDYQHATRTREEHLILRRAGLSGCRNRVPDEQAIIGTLARIGGQG